jgi:hypothetical protein
MTPQCIERALLSAGIHFAAGHLDKAFKVLSDFHSRANGLGLSKSRDAATEEGPGLVPTAGEGGIDAEDDTSTLGSVSMEASQDNNYYVVQVERMVERALVSIVCIVLKCFCGSYICILFFK